MVLTGGNIKRQNNSNLGLKIQPFNEEQLNPNSYNLKLHNELLIYKNNLLDIKKNNDTVRIKIPEEGYKLKPGVLYLGRTYEYTEAHSYVPMIEGRSSIGRLGLSIHITAGFGDLGFCGYWTLELQCIQPIIIYPYIEICQIYFYTILANKQDKLKKYQGKYQSNSDIQSSHLYKDF